MPCPLERAADDEIRWSQAVWEQEMLDACCQHCLILSAHLLFACAPWLLAVSDTSSSLLYPSGASRRVEAQEGFRLELINHARIQEGGGVAEVGGVILGDFSQDATHDLATPRLGQRTGKDDVVRHGEGADGLADTHQELFLQSVVTGHTILEDDIAEEAGT
eukprot:CAMPEP_0194769554 /NCGR_PEP_ID=MMETSP0323_2-20130528/43520_1 /TAXON_ID=2866 ORGANISM="Crypthecodinium cohnii, Strain Seligo" /NCGR_SAMPLE_ID=MMETSP0323_2 /ASSEMBLY_ACC=CAM_ASM_000346 /LENGTH=161 /DNA_ID=CAMNT_0039702609 /DNA_START=94 /DNA_END=575 /DNA_ORIENTATION=+